MDNFLNIFYTIITVLSVITNWFFLKKNRKHVENNKKYIEDWKQREKIIEKLQTEIIKQAQPPVIIWIVSEYTPQDIDLLSKNTETIDVILRILEFFIAKKTDSIRNLYDWVSYKEKVWKINAYHEIYGFFHKIRYKKDKIEDLTWHDLL